MPIATLFLVLAGAVVTFALYPHLRIAAGAVIIVFGALVGYIVFNSNAERERIATRILPEQIILSDIAVTEGSRYFNLEGRVENTSPEFRLREFELKITLFDCPEAPEPDSDHEGCAIIGENTTVSRVDVPAGQTRAFEAVVQFIGVPSVKGTLDFGQEIVSVRAIP